MRVHDAFSRKSHCAAVVLGVCLLAGNMEGAANEKKPNLLFVFPDQFRRQALGFMNEDPVHTPHLDEFAAQSLVFTDAISNLPLCSPYRAMLLTGKYPYRTGVTTNCNSKSGAKGNYLRKTERCLTDVLRDTGYCVGYIGKWHLDAPTPPYVEEPHYADAVHDSWTPPDRRHGVDFWYAYGMYNDHLKPHYWTTSASKSEKTEVDEWSPKHETDVALRYLRNGDGTIRDGDKPFALFLSMNPPHPPFPLVPEKYKQRYENLPLRTLLNRGNVDHGRLPKRFEAVREYFAAVTGVDEQFGRLMAGLRETALDRDTIVVFTSDHGEMMKSHGRMAKGIYYEESIGIPFIVRWPGVISPGQDDLLLSVPDIMPTLLGLMGLEGQIPKDVEGSDYSDVFRGQETERPASALYYWFSNVRGVRTRSHTMIVDRRGKEEETLLFDNISDRYQMTNAAADAPEVVEKCRGELDFWLKKTNDPWSGGPQ